MPNQFWTDIGGMGLQMGAQAGGDIIGAGMGLLLGGIERKKQLEQQQKLQNMQIAGAQQMGIFNREQQMKLWEDTNYSAQMAQLKKAGLNPGLIYGMGGGGGTTANAQPGQVTGAQARQGGEALGMALQMGQAAQTAAQIQLVKAETEKVKAETLNVPKTGQQIEASTGTLLQGIQESKTKQALMEVETAIKSIEEHVLGKTQNAAIATIMKNLEILNNDATISNETKNGKIKQVYADLRNTIADTLNKQQQTAKSEKEVQHIAQQIKMLEQEYNINKIDEEMAAEGFNPKAGGVLKLIHNLVKLIMGL